MARTMRRLGYPKSKTLFMAWIDELAPDNAAAEGFFGRMKTESVYPEHWEERTSGCARPDRRVHPLVQP